MPLKKWGELASSDAYKKLSPGKQEKAREGYFTENVAPNVSPERLPELRKAWDARTGLARPATPAPGVAKPNANVTTPQAMARPTSAKQVAPQQAQTPRPGAPEGGKGFFEGVKDYGRGLVKGAVQSLPEAAAGLIDYSDTPEFDAQGKSLGDNGEFSKFARDVREGAEKRGENWQQSEYGKFAQEQNAYSPHGAAFEAGEMTPLSFGLTIAGAVIGGVATKSLKGAQAGASIGGLASLPLFFGHEAKSSYDQVYAEQKASNPEITDEQAHDTAMEAGGITGMIEAGGELIADRVGLGLFKHMPGPVKKNLVKQSTKAIQGIVPMMKGMAKVLVTEVGTELAQGASQAEVMESYGVGGGAKWDEQKRVIMPTILMSLVGGGASMGISANQRYQMASALQNPKRPPEERIQAASQMAGAIAQEDKELGQMFYDYAATEIAAGRPVIAQDDRFYRDVKPGDQRKVDKEAASGQPTGPSGSPITRPGTAVEQSPARAEFEEVEGDGSVIVPPAPESTVEPLPRPGQLPDIQLAHEAEPEVPLEDRHGLMANLNTQLSRTQQELKVAKDAGNKELVSELNDELQALAANFKRITNGEMPVPTPRQQKEAQQWSDGALTTPAEEADPRPVLQNRDRSTPASIEQMTMIAADPDYTRLGFSRDFANGAPVVEPGVNLPPEYIGRDDVATTATGRQIQVQYAVVEADELLPSNSADGSRIEEYGDGVDGMSRAIAGNGRIAGLQRAYEQGNAATYMDDMSGDSELHGIDQAVILDMVNPILVRIMPQDEVTDDIGDESNTSGVAELSPAEQARNDTKRININEVDLDDMGEPSRSAVEQFIASMPTAERAGLLDGKEPNRRAYDRLGNAMFAQAFESDELLRLAAEATDEEMRTLMAGLKIAAGKMSRLKGAGDYDIRPLIVEAAETAVKAKRRGQTLPQYLEQGDMGRNPYVTPILEMMAENSRSAKKIGAQLSIMADAYYTEASRPENDMFGEVEKRPPTQIMDELYGTGKIDTQDQKDALDTGGTEPDQGVVGGEIPEQPVTEIEEGTTQLAQEGLERPDQPAADSEDVADVPTDTATEAPKVTPKVAKKPKKAKKTFETKAESLDAEIDAAAAELAELLKPKPGTLTTGVDPQVLLAGAKLGSLYVQKGVLKFALWSKAIIDKLRSMGVDPDQIKPHLKEIYLATQGSVTDEQFDQMDDARAVRAFDLDTLDAEGFGETDVVDAVEAGGAIFQNGRGSMYYTVTPPVNGKGKYQVTVWDKDGAVSDSRHDNAQNIYNHYRSELSGLATEQEFKAFAEVVDVTKAGESDTQADLTLPDDTQTTENDENHQKELARLADESARADVPLFQKPRVWGEGDARVTVTDEGDGKFSYNTVIESGVTAGMSGKKGEHPTALDAAKAGLDSVQAYLEEHQAKTAKEKKTDKAISKWVTSQLAIVAESTAITEEATATAENESTDGQGSMFGAAPVAEQTMADAKAAKDKKRDGTKDVPADVDGGLFSNQLDQASIFDAEPEQSADQPTAEEIDAKAHEAATSQHNDLPDPTESQIEADNYKKGEPFTLHGQKIVIENPKGSERKGTDAYGKAWKNIMGAHYGDLKSTTAADGDNLDVFVGENPESTRIWVIDQKKTKGDKGGFDEHKIGMAFSSKAEFEKAYLASYDKGWGVGPVFELSVDEFKNWVSSGDTTKSYAKHVSSLGDKPPPKPKQKSKAKKVPILDRLENYFVPGRVVEGYSGKDRVIKFDRVGDHNWQVTVIEVEDYRGKAIDGAPERTHSTAPDSKTLGSWEKENPVTAAMSEQATVPGVDAAPKIEDFGEKIGGAAKDNYNRLNNALSAEIDVSALPLSKAFPVPDYVKLAEEGINRKALVLIAQIRGELGAKPRNRRKLTRWAEKVDTARSVSASLLSGNIEVDAFLKKMAGSDSYAAHTPAIMDLADDIQPEYLDLLGDYKITHAHYSLYKGENDVWKWELTNTKKDGGFGGMANREQFDSIDEAVATIRKDVIWRGENRGNAPKGKRAKTRLDLYAKRGEDGVWIGKKVASRKYIDLKRLDSTKEARAYLAEHNDELIADLEKKKQIPAMRREINNTRIGPDYRNGVDVTPEQFTESFGFRGVEFGNWVEGGKRQDDLNQAFDGLMDMASMLGIPSKAISLNGELGLAFGARGRGGKNPAAAHYESGKVVINLTKKGGAGSLSHEWFHALDNYFDRMRKGAGFATDDPRQRIINREGGRDTRVRQEVLDGLAGIVAAIKKSGIPARAAHLDNTRTKDYWGTTRELTARAFEKYLIDRFAVDENASDYLANIVDEDFWNASYAMDAFIAGGDQDTKTYPYPTDEEAPAINAAYQSFFDTLKTKETDQGVALFSKLTAAPDATGTSVDFVEKAIKTAMEKLNQEPGVNVKVVKGLKDIPDAVSSKAEPDARYKGVYHDGTVYIFADNITDAKDARITLAHELVGHKGVLEMSSGKEWTDIKSTISDLINSKSKPALSIKKEVDARYGDIDSEKFNKEFMAVAAERKIKRGAIGGLVAKFKEVIRRFLKLYGLNTFSDSELDIILSNAEGYLRQDDGRIKITDKLFSQAKKLGYQGSDKGEAAEWIKGIEKYGKEGMTSDARMARAEAMGFDTSVTMYHGTAANIDGFQLAKHDEVPFRTVSVSTDPEYASHYAMDSFGRREDQTYKQQEDAPISLNAALRRLKQGKPVYAGTGAAQFEVGVIKGRRGALDYKIPAKDWDDTNPASLPQSNLYAEPSEMAEAFPDGIQPNVLPVYVRGKTPDYLDAIDMYDEAHGPVVNESFGSEGPASDVATSEQLQEWWESQGITGVTMFGDETAMFDPSNIRSTNAAFNEDDAGSDSLLASKAATGPAIAPAELTKKHEDKTINTWDTKHAQTGDTVYMAGAKDRVESDKFTDMRQAAKEHGGYWSRFGKAGFLFKTAEERDSFVAAMDLPATGDATIYSKSAILDEDAKPKGMAIKKAQKIVDVFRAGFHGVNDGLNVLIHPTQDGAFGPAIRKKYNRIKGGFDPDTNTLHIVAENIDDVKDLEATVRHELFVHKGLGLFEVAEQEKLLAIIAREAPTSKTLAPLWEQVLKDYKDDTRVKQAEELLAAVAEGRYNPVDKVWIKIVNWIRKALTKIGFIPQSLSRTDLMAIVYDMGDAFAEGHRAQRRIVDAEHREAGGDFLSATGTADEFYSGLAEAAGKLKQEKGTPAQMLASMKKIGGVKEEELEWAGLPEYLATVGKSVTKQQIVDFLANNGVQVKTVALGEDSSPYKDMQVMSAGRVESNNGDFWRVTFADGYHQSVEDDQVNLLEEEGTDGTWPPSVIEKAREKAGKYATFADGPKYEGEELNVPGGTNYREVLLTLPDRPIQGKPPEPITELPKDYEIGVDSGPSNQGPKRWYVSPARQMHGMPMAGYHNKKEFAIEAALERINDAALLNWQASRRDQEKASRYTGGHYGGDTPNVLAHIRMDDRVGTNGEKVLFIQEVQSDLHQTGKKEGYRNDKDRYNIASRREAADNLVEDRRPDAMDSIEENDRLGFDTLTEAARNIMSHDDWAERWDVQDPYAVKRINEWRDAGKEYRRLIQLEQSGVNSVPNAPFKGNAWVELAAKKILRLAAEGGYDRVAWTTGKQQADRYSLRKQVDKITVVGRTDAATGEKSRSVLISFPGGQALTLGVNNDGMVDNAGASNDEMSGKSLDDIVGKEMAKKIMESPPGTEMSGDDLEVGGEGLIAFYDKNLPNVFKKVARKLDKKAGVSMADIRNAEVELVRGKVTFGWDSSQQMTSFMDDVINVGLDNEEYKLKVHMEGFVEFRDLPPSTYKDFENFADSNEGIIEITGRSVGREETFVAQGIDITPTLSNTAMERGQTLFRAEGTGTGSSNILFRKEETETREYTEGQQAAIDRGGFGKQSPSEKLKTKWESAKHRFKTKLRQGMVDQFASLKDVLEDDRAWMMAHLTSSAPGAVEAIIKHGQPYLKENAIAINTETSGLQEIIKPLGSEMDDWLAWMAGYRADRLKQEGRENLFEIEDIEALKSLSDGEMSGGRNREEVYQSTRKEFEKLGNSITQVAVDTGLIGEEEAKIWNEQGFYVPFYRTLEEGEARGPRALGGLAKQTAYKKLKGGTSQLNDLMTNVLMNWNHLISASLKNQAASHALQAAVDMGIATKVSSKAKSKDAIYVREDGKEQWFELNDDQDGSLVLDSLVSLNWSGLNTRSMKMMGVFKRALTRGVTLNPEFRIANGMRDTLTAIAVAPMSKNFAKNVAQGWKAAGKESDTLIQMLAGGGAFGTSGYIDGTSPEAIKRLVDMGVNKDTILDPRGTLKKAFDAYEAFGARTENMNRAANYEQALEKDKDLLTANFESRDHLDFTRTGSFMAVRALARVVPFLNARMQGIDKLSRAAMDKNQQAQFATVVGMYTLASIALMLAMRDDDDYEEAQEWEKDAYHLFKLPGSDVLFRLPRPFEVGAIGAMSERVLQQFIDDEATGKLFAERLSHTLLETFSMNPIPQAAKPLIELYANKSFFTGRDIESMSQQRLSPERRVRSTTTDTAKALSKAAAAVLPESATLSPLQIDHLVRGYLGWAGTTILGATDMLVTRPISGAPERPARHITEYPVIKRFARSGVPYSTKFTQIYYDRLRELNQVYADISDAKKQGEFEEARSMQKDSASKLRYRSKINRVNKNIQNMRRRINNIRGSGHYTPKQQRKEIDAIQSRINRLQKITVQSSDKAFN